jgi:hypothetical protein
MLRGRIDLPAAAACRAFRAGADRRFETKRSEDLMASITEHEERQANRANASGRNPDVFVHGLWLLPSS